MYKSKPSLLTCALVFFALLSLFVAIYAFTHPSLTIEGKDSPKDTPVVFLGFFAAILFTIIISTSRRRIAAITVGNDFLNVRYFIKPIRFNSDQIKSIELLARRNPGFFDSENKINGLEIISISGRAYFFPDKFIGNSARLKQELETFCIKNQITLIPFTGNNAKATFPFDSDRKIFAGNYLTSGIGISLFIIVIMLLLFPVWIIHFRESSGLYPFFFSMALLYVIISSFQANYFTGINNKLTVKNHLAFWKNKQFDLEDIRCAAFEEKQKASTSLRIVFKDYSSKRYYAGSLRDKHWQALKDYLESNNIPVAAENLF